jgi:gas vesicle protein
MRKRLIDKLIGLLIGAAIGVAIGFLTAPRSGFKTRAMLNDKSKETLEMVMSQYQEKRDQAEELLNELNQDLTERAENLKIAGKKVLDREREVLREGVEEAKQAVSK